MAENKHTAAELAQWQALPLEVKIQMTCYRIREWVREFGQDGVYISFSGGKDSTVLLDLVRNKCGYTDVPAIFVDTGLEYPEIREFVKTFYNVEWLRPKKNFKQVVDDYGYPFISKEISGAVGQSIKFLQKKFPNEDDLIKAAETLEIGEMTARLSELFGRRNEFAANRHNRENWVETSTFNKNKWKFLLNAPFIVSSNCCNVMKKTPSHEYAKRTGRNVITGEQASESRIRFSQWLQRGCNGFDMKIKKSTPMAFWTEQDILEYIKKYGNDMVEHRIAALEAIYGCKLEEITDSKTGKPKYNREDFTPICSVYGEIVEDVEGTEEVEGQLTISDIAGFEDCKQFDAERPKLKTTGCDRMGCMFCGYGCHREKEGEGRFERMKLTHPAQYDYIMRPKEQGGLNYKEVIDWLNENGNLKIRY